MCNKTSTFPKHLRDKGHNIDFLNNEFYIFGENYENSRF